MHIADNILEHHLRHVYFIAGTNCGGKTTMADYLAKKHGMAAYHADYMYAEHRPIASSVLQPAMTRHFIDFEWFFNRPEREYMQWIFDAEAEEMGMILLDLVKLPADRPVVAEVYCFPEVLKRISRPDRVVFLLAAPGVSRSEYFSRGDKQDMYECILRQREPEKMLRHVLDTVEYGAGVEYERAMQSGMKCIVRDGSRTLEQTAELVERHFGLIS